MKIPAFAWAYIRFSEAKAWLTNTEVWQAIRALSRAARHLADIKKSRCSGPSALLNAFDRDNPDSDAPSTKAEFHLFQGIELFASHRRENQVSVEEYHARARPRPRRQGSATDGLSSGSGNASLNR